MLETCSLSSCRYDLEPLSVSTFNARKGGAQLSGAGYPHFLTQSQDAGMPESRRDICEGQGQVRGQNNSSKGNILEELTENHLLLLPFHHHDKYTTCQNIPSLLASAVSDRPSGITIKIRGEKTQCSLSCQEVSRSDLTDCSIKSTCESEERSSCSIGSLTKDAQMGFWLEHSRTFRGEFLSLSCIAKVPRPLIHSLAARVQPSYTLQLQRTVWMWWCSLL